MGGTGCVGTLKVALVQMRSEKGDIARNLDCMISYLEDGVANGTDVVCFPEACITGYADPARYPEAALTWEAPEVERLVAWSAGRETAAIVGLIEVNPGGRPFLSQGVVSMEALQGVYRKQTIAEDESGSFAPGTELPLFRHGGATFGLGLCADYTNRDLFAQYAARGADVVFLCAAPGLYGEQATRNWQSGYEWWRGECQEKLSEYAADLGVHIAVATQAGSTVDEDFPGGGYIFDPQGICLASTANWSEGMLVGEIELS